MSNAPDTTTPTTTPTTAMTSRRWYRLRYHASAPVGLPPVICANHLLRYADHDGEWVAALWEHDADDVAACVLRLPATQLRSATRHIDLHEAARQPE